jgi:antitoxin (DNA-binding transcriptional repressor) of toxin-antitoxin stability system
MIEISDIEADERFADLPDAVERRGETFLVVRGGTIVATIAPARGTGADLRRIRAQHPPDDRRSAVGCAPHEFSTRSKHRGTPADRVHKRVHYV